MYRWLRIETHDIPLQRGVIDTYGIWIPINGQLRRIKRYMIMLYVNLIQALFL